MGRGGLRKAAMLLANLDASTAADLLKGQPPEVVQQIAMELSHLDATGQTGSEESGGVIADFCAALDKTRSGSLHVQSFVSSMLKGSAGKERAAELHAQMQKAIHDKDPFIGISSASPTHIASVLEGEPPVAIAVVLSSLPAKLSTEVLARLSEETGLKTVWKMSKPGEIPPKTIHRIGELVCKRLMELAED